MPIHPEVVRLNLEYYRKQAKALLKSAQAGVASAMDRLSLHQKDLKTAALHDAQLAVAREQGFPSWPRFKTFIEESRLNFQELVAAFIGAATSDLNRAEAILNANPKIEDAGFYVALVLGKARQVESALAENSELARRKSGPQNVEPLIYTCFSRYAGRKSSRAADLVETTRALLRHRADPSAAFTPEDLPGNPLSCLYGSTGLNNNPHLALALLEAGANPNDNESLYHSTEHSDLTCFKLLLRYGAKTKNTNALKHMLDREETEGLRLLLDAGADPNETNERGETALHWAASRGRSPQIVAMLLDHGAAINAKRHDGRTAYALAAFGGEAGVAALLRDRGADTTLSALDQFVADCATASPAELGPLLASHPEIAAMPQSQHMLPHLAISHNTAAVRALLAAGVPVNARGEHGGTALHWACWKGYADLVGVLLENGAALDLEDKQFHAPPAGWLHHGSTNCGDPGGDYAEVARLLLAANAPMTGCATPTGNAELDAVLREHKLIE